jgi:hypothetical protein
MTCSMMPICRCGLPMLCIASTCRLKGTAISWTPWLWLIHGNKFLSDATYLPGEAYRCAGGAEVLLRREGDDLHAGAKGEQAEAPRMASKVTTRACKALRGSGPRSGLPKQLAKGDAPSPLEHKRRLAARAGGGRQCGRDV